MKQPDVVRISAAAFLRSMLTLAWTTFRHPFSITVVDLSTGKVVWKEEPQEAPAK